MQTIAAFVLAVATLVGISLIMAVPTMLLWDWLMPELFGLKTITLFQAWGLNFLCGMLFKSHTSVSK
jgi:hypothetical protein